MSDSIPPGKSPVVIPPSVRRPPGISRPPINVEATKRVFIAALETTKGHRAAADKLSEATFSLVGTTLEIQTNVSAMMLPLLFNADAQQVLSASLAEHGQGSMTIEILPGMTKRVAYVPAASDKPSAPFKRLADSAAKLNKVSDQLTKQVEEIDAALKRLNLGVSAWVTITNTEDEDGNCYVEKLGYVRIGSKWGIALKTASGMRGETGDETFSAFADAPRQLRIRAVEHIPMLLEQLSVEAEKMIANLSPKVDEITELTRSLQAAPGGTK